MKDGATFFMKLYGLFKFFYIVLIFIILDKIVIDQLEITFITSSRLYFLYFSSHSSSEFPTSSPT